MTIRLKTIEDVNNFVNICSKCDHDVYAIQDELKINAKSILGIYSLNLLKEFEVATSIDNFYKNIERWKC